MEKMLHDLDHNWKSLEFDYELHPSGYKLLRASEELIETLEENQVDWKRTMSGGPYCLCIVLGPDTEHDDKQIHRLLSHRDQ